MIQYPDTPGYFVYVHRNAAGDPLYIGRTKAPRPRTEKHRTGGNDSKNPSPWYGDIDHIEWIRFDDYEQARKTERIMIESLRPTFNRRMVPRTGGNPPKPGMEHLNHGTPYTYSKHACRCWECREAHRVDAYFRRHPDEKLATKRAAA